MNMLASFDYGAHTLHLAEVVHITCLQIGVETARLGAQRLNCQRFGQYHVSACVMTCTRSHPRLTTLPSALQ